MPLFQKQQILYIRIRRDSFEIKALDQAISHVARSLRGFSSDRLLIGQFSEARSTLLQALKDLQPSTPLLALRPEVLMHPLEIISGGLSEVEERVLQDLAHAAGARSVVIWVGRELRDEEVRERLRQGS